MSRVRYNLYFISFLAAASVTFGLAIGMIRNQAAINTSDLIAYRSATHLFFDGANPYDPQLMKEAEAHSFINAEAVPFNDIEDPLMVWNPPILFVLLGAYFSLDSMWLNILAPTISLFAVSMMTLVGWQIGTSLQRDNDRHVERSTWVPLFIVTICSFPLLAEIYVMQFSSFLALVQVLGLIAATKKRDFQAGIFLSVAVIKPHLLLLPLLLLSVWIIRYQRFRIIAGGVVSLATLFIIAEARYPGILTLWIWRETWPINYIGSSMPSLVSSIMKSFGIPVSAAICLATPILLLVVFFLWRGRRALTPEPQEFVKATAFSPFISPYGFVFDQSSLLLVTGYMIGRTPDSKKRNMIIALTLIASAITLLLTGVTIGRVEISWYLCPVTTFLLMQWSERSIANSSKMKEELLKTSSI